MVKYSYYFVIVVLISLSSCSILGIRSGYDQVDYQLIEKIGLVEIRDYPERLVAEVVGISNRREAFMSLFAYIDGQNKTQQDIKMTAPVELLERTDNVLMRFFLPVNFKQDSAPAPINSKVSLKTLSSARFAVLRYSGSTDLENFTQEKEKLLKIIAKSDYKAKGNVSFLGYDPPFTIPFLKRNEVIVEVEKK